MRGRAPTEDEVERAIYRAVGLGEQDIVKVLVTTGIDPLVGGCGASGS